jgi:hypothetical protein
MVQDSTVQYSTGQATWQEYIYIAAQERRRQDYILLYMEDQEQIILFLNTVTLRIWI